MTRHSTPRRGWTEDQIDLVRKLRTEDGLMRREIAAKIGRSENSVAKLCEALKIPRAPRAPIPRDSTGFPVPRRYTADEIAWAMEHRDTSRDAKAIMALVEAGVA
jgi:hypothetical protein